MDTALRERAKTWVVLSTRGLRAWALVRLSLVLTAARQRVERQSRHVPPAARATVQRFGAQLWRRVATRFPALDALVSDSVAPSPIPTQSAPTQSATVQPTQDVGDVQALVRALRDPSAEVAAAAASTLGLSTDPATLAECRQALLEVLTDADRYFHPLTRVAALQAWVHHLSGQATTEELAPLLRAVRDVDAEVSIAAIAAVATHAPIDVAIDCLGPIAVDASGYFLPVVQNAATRALERIGQLTRA